jgi:hypothetical protein
MSSLLLLFSFHFKIYRLFMTNSLKASIDNIGQSPFGNVTRYIIQYYVCIIIYVQ